MELNFDHLLENVQGYTVGDLQNLVDEINRENYDQDGRSN